MDSQHSQVINLVESLCKSNAKEVSEQGKEKEVQVEVDTQPDTPSANVTIEINRKVNDPEELEINVTGLPIEIMCQLYLNKIMDPVLKDQFLAKNKTK